MLYKCIMVNTSAIWQQAAHTTYQLPSCSYPARAGKKGEATDIPEIPRRMTALGFQNVFCPDISYNCHDYTFTE